MPAPLCLPTCGAVTGDEPVFHYRADHFLPDGQYQQLYDSFPGPQWFDETIEGNKQRLNSRRSPALFSRFIDQHPQWRAFFTQLGSPAFVDPLYQLMKGPLTAIRGPLGGRPWRVETTPPCASPSPADWFRRRALMNFEFSRLERGSMVPPHTDAPEKLATLILYFAPPDWRTEWGGATLFYRPRDPALLNNWHNRRVPFEQLTPVLTNAFVPNRLFIFAKSADSYHGLPTIQCPADRVRNSVNINLLVPPATRLRRLRKTGARFRRHLEQRRHPW